MAARKKLSEIYRIMFDKYKARGWWPIIITKLEDQKNVSENSAIDQTNWICKYGIDAPRTKEEAFEIAIGAVLTQNTSWKNVEKALINLAGFASNNSANSAIGARMIMKMFPTPQEISSMPLEKLEALIKPSGFYKQKALRIKDFSKFVLSFGSMKNFTTEINRETLLEQKGIGPETADSILLYACKKPEFVVDAYTKRIFSRIGLVRKDENYEEVKKLFEENMPKDIEIYSEYHALIVEHAKNFCQKKPMCKECPLYKICKKLI